MHTTLVELSPPFTSPTTVEVTFHEDGVALEGNETFQLHLVPITPFNHSGVDFRDSVALSIQDSDGMFCALKSYNEHSL